MDNLDQGSVGDVQCPHCLEPSGIEFHQPTPVLTVQTTCKACKVDLEAKFQMGLSCWCDLIKAFYSDWESAQRSEFLPAVSLQ